MLEEALCQNKTIAQELLNKGASEKAPELPEGFGVKVRVSRKKVEDQLEELTKTQLWQQKKLEDMKKDEGKENEGKKGEDEGKQEDEGKKEDEAKEDDHEGKQDEGEGKQEDEGKTEDE